MSIKRFFLLFLAILTVLTSFSGCKNNSEAESGLELQKIKSMDLEYATQFSVDYYEGGYKLITLADGSKFFTVPDGKELPPSVDKTIVPLYQPISNIYLAATSAMCLFDSLDRLDSIRLSGTKEDGWYIENAKKAMRDGKIVYAGKYSAPDYELITASKCPLAIESLMIGHASEIKTQLEALGIAVLVDQSSNETHPLGRAEWIKLYGALLNEEEKAEKLFSKQSEYLKSVEKEENTGKTVAFFYISSTGRIVTRKSGDYVCKMISLAGGKYVFDDLGDKTSKTSTVTLEPEFFYSSAKDADIIIYNSAIADEITTVNEMISKCALLSDFKAVKGKNVWCTSKNMYQETTALGEMIGSLHNIFTDDTGILEDQPYFFRLK